MRTVVVSALFVPFLIVIVAMQTGCNKDNNPVTSGGNLFFSFTSNRGNFLANGTFNDTVTSGSGAKGYRSSANSITIIAYRFNSPSDVDVVALILSSTNGLKTQTYQYGSSGTSALFLYAPHVNTSGTISITEGYVLISGSVIVSSITSDHIQGTFSGTGFLSSNTSQTISVTGGSFNTSYVMGSPKTEPWRLDE